MRWGDSNLGSMLSVRSDAKDIWQDIDHANFVTEELKARFPEFYETVVAWDRHDIWVKLNDRSEELLVRSQFYNRKFIAEYWTRVMEMLPRPEQLEVFIWEFGRLSDYVLANGKTGGYLISTTRIVCEQIVRMWNDRPLGTMFRWSFEPTTLGKV